MTTVLAWAPEESVQPQMSPWSFLVVYVNAERVTEMVSEDAEIGDFWSMDMIRDGSELEPPKAEEGVSAEEAAAAAAMWQLPRNSRFLIDIAPLMEHLINPGSASWSGKLPVKDAAPEPPKDSADDDFVADEDAPAPPQPPCIFCYGQFDRPLVPAPTKPPEPELMARDIIPLRPDPAKKPPPLAAKLFRDEVKATVKDLAAEISQLFGDNLSANGEGPDARRKKFLYHLNSSGKYGAFREKLKHAVGRLVKERFAEQSELDDGTLRDKFISDLYIHLMEETLVVINAMSMEAKGVPLPSENAPAEKSKTDLLLRSAAGDTSAMLQRLLALAAEAEANGNNRIAEERYESCVAASEEAAAKNFSRKVEGGGAAPWMGYAYFCCRLENFAKATSCCEEAVAVNDPPSPDALLLLAALRLAKGNSEEALALLRTLAEAADSSSTTIYALMSMCHTMRPKETKKAKKALLQATANGATDTEVFADLAVFLSRVHLTELSTIALRLAMGASISSTISSQGASSKESSEDVEADDFIWGAEDVPRKLRLKMSWLNAANTYFNGSMVEAQRLAVRSIQQGEACGEGWLIKGHCLWAQGDVDGAIQAYQAALPRLEMSAAEDAPQEIGLYALYILLAQAYIKKGGDACLKAAKEVSLRASKSVPSASTWLYAGIAALRLGELDEAEEALSEANILDNMNPEVWGQLTLLCLRTVPERRAEADQSFAQAVKLNLENADTLAAIGVAYKKSGRLQPAESALRRALAVRENPGLQITLGEVLASQNRHEDALEVYELVLGSSEANESDKRLAAKGAKASRASLGGMKK